MKAKALKTVNLLLAAAFLVQAATGIFHDLMPYGVFAMLHKPAGPALVILILIHIYLNRNWVKSVLFKRRNA